MVSVVDVAGDSCNISDDSSPTAAKSSAGALIEWVASTAAAGAVDSRFLVSKDFPTPFADVAAAVSSVAEVSTVVSISDLPGEVCPCGELESAAACSSEDIDSIGEGPAGLASAD